ncbi:hypothetical protein ACLKA7_015766 [Drosophila subpalustris]
MLPIHTLTTSVYTLLVNIIEDELVDEHKEDKDEDKETMKAATGNNDNKNNNNNNNDNDNDSKRQTAGSLHKDIAVFTTCMHTRI